MLPAPLMSVLIAISAVSTLSIVVPALRGPLPRARFAVPLLVGAVLVACALPAAILAGGIVGLYVVALGAALAIPAYWLAQAPPDPPDEGDDRGGGGAPPAPRIPGGGIDWESFDRIRADWARPRRRGRSPGAPVLSGLRRPRGRGVGRD